MINLLKTLCKATHYTSVSSYTLIADALYLLLYKIAIETLYTYAKNKIYNVTTYNFLFFFHIINVLDTIFKCLFRL